MVISWQLRGLHGSYLWVCIPHLFSPRESPCVALTSYAVVTPLRKAASYELRIAILGIWGDTWLTRGKYGIYVVVTGPLWGLRDAFCHVQSARSTALSPTWR